MLAHLFVYGTLRPGSTGGLGSQQRSRLARESRLVGSATLQAHLFDLGRYPGAVETPDPAAVVHGEVVRLNNPVATFKWLDAYEGLAPGDPDPEYARNICPVRLASGDEATAWVYLYRWPTRTGRLVVDGRWKPSMGD